MVSGPPRGRYHLGKLLIVALIVRSRPSPFGQPHFSLIPSITRYCKKYLERNTLSRSIAVNYIYFPLSPQSVRDYSPDRRPLMGTTPRTLASPASEECHLKAITIHLFTCIGLFLISAMLCAMNYGRFSEAG